MDLKKVDIEKMKDETGYSLFTIKNALEITFNESEEFENEIKNLMGSTEIKCLDLREMYNVFSEPDVKVKIFNKWSELTLLRVKRARTPQDAKEAFDDAPPKSEAKKVAKKKWEKLVLKELKSLETLADIKSAYENALPNSKVEIKAFKMWLKLLTTKEEIWDAECETRCGSVSSKMAIKKLAEFYIS